MQTDCNSFQFLESDGDCSIYASYDTCQEGHENFECWVSGFDPEYNEQYQNDCTTDFEDVDFWTMMRSEAWWADHPEYSDFLWYWDTYHFGESDICDTKFLDATCDDFSFIPGECQIYVEYNPCMTQEDYDFVCQISHPDGTFQDCREDFEDYDFWTAMRSEMFWLEDGSDRFYDFFMYWEDVHGYSDDSWVNEGECEWKDINANCFDFEFTSADECHIHVSYSPCVDDHFVCEIESYDEFGEIMMEDCEADFEDREFWSEMRQEQFWLLEENQQFFDFYLFWENYHT